jgi:nucleotide-binding universal stress UspA family protein
MANRFMIALNSSEGAWHAVEYVGRVLGQTPAVEVTLIHILPELPPDYLEEGHILREEEKKIHDRLVRSWETQQEKKWEDLFQRAQNHLIAAGISASSIKRILKPASYDIAEEILQAARAGNYSTIVLGHGGRGKIASFLLGSITESILHQAHGMAITIVE